MRMLVTGLSLIGHATLKAPPRAIGPTFSGNQNKCLDVISSLIDCVPDVFLLLLQTMAEQTQQGGVVRLAALELMGELEHVVDDWCTIGEYGRRKNLAGFRALPHYEYVSFPITLPCCGILGASAHCDTVVCQ